jgi:hypothetical protein
MPLLLAIERPSLESMRLLLESKPLRVAAMMLSFDNERLPCLRDGPAVFVDAACPRCHDGKPTA